MGKVAGRGGGRGRGGTGRAVALISKRQIVSSKAQGLLWASQTTKPAEGAAGLQRLPPSRAHTPAPSPAARPRLEPRAGPSQSMCVPGARFSDISRAARNLGFHLKSPPSEMLETNSKCFGYYTSQITHICGPDAAPECPLADADAGGKPSRPRDGQ